MARQLFIVICWNYNYPVHTYSVHRIYDSKERAEKVCIQLNNDNTDPMEEDDYGPLRGTLFAVWERELDE